jgi:hypothetical protein
MNNIKYITQFQSPVSSILANNAMDILLELPGIKLK